MRVRKKTLWRVPLYCIIAGVVIFYLMIHLLARFAIVTLPDGSVEVNDTRSLIIADVVFTAVVLLGGFVFFHNMTKKEIFFSATIIVAFDRSGRRK